MKLKLKNKYNCEHLKLTEILTSYAKEIIYRATSWEF
jgi:hypothetical protein